MNTNGQNIPVSKNEDQQKEKKESAKVTMPQENDKLRGEVEKWKQSYMRALADYENLERRTYQQISSFQKKDKKNILLKFLDVLDDIEQGAVFIKDKGLQLVRDKFIKILVSEGIQELEVMGEPFDPFTAECVEVVAGKKENDIIEVLRKGYKLHDEVIRPARVKVEKKAE